MNPAVVWIWSQPQTVFGCVLYHLVDALNAYVNKKRYKEARVIYLPVQEWGVSLGPYIFLSEDNVLDRDLRHEYGHTIQSYYLGPLYLLIVGVPSVILKFASLYSDYVNEHYFNFWPESWAERLGEVEEI